MAAAKGSRARRLDARELATTPVADPYRGQLSDPYSDVAPPADVALFGSRGGGGVSVVRPAAAAAPPPLQFRRKAPTTVVTVGVIEIILGIAVGVLGLLVIALVNLVNNLGNSDRSFYQGSDAAYLLMGVLDLAVCAVLVGGGIALLTGRLTGRIALTAGNWAVIGFSVFWWGQHQVPLILPLSLLVTSATALAVSYQRSVTEWLGVLPSPQPE
jgi:hypothetical protein